MSTVTAPALRDYVVYGRENGHDVAIPVQATTPSEAQRLSGLQPPVTVMHANGQGPGSLTAYEQAGGAR